VSEKSGQRQEIAIRQTSVNFRLTELVSRRCDRSP